MSVVMYRRVGFWGLEIVCAACLFACGGRSQSDMGTPSAGASGAFESAGAAGATDAGAAGGGGAAGTSDAGAAGEGGVAGDATDADEGGEGGVFGEPNPQHACDGQGGAVVIGMLEGRQLKIQNKVNTNLPFDQFAPGSSYGLRAELAGLGTVLRFDEWFVDYDHGGYVDLEIQLSGLPRLRQKLAVDASTVDNLHFGVGINKGWDPVPGQTITVQGMARSDGACATQIAFDLKRLRMQPSALAANEAQGTFEFDGVILFEIDDYH